MSAVVDHAKKARGLLDDVDHALGSAGPTPAWAITAAQVHATLALVEEQRTANLVAFLARSEDRMRAEAQQQLHDVITARLDFTPKES